ncbi:MAG: DUF2812 domain-containing protein [Anaerolineae bacterium]|jgi:hypothetical protein|nr:DUF2812 domain-containing protein [Anaerolineae bacterium]
MKTNEKKLTKRCVRYFGAWQAEKEERWLNEMAQQGWLLTDVTSMIYRFRRIEPKNWVYQLDFMELTGDDVLDYQQLFKDAGWDYVTNLTHWHYFRADGDAHVQRIHTDLQSRIAVLQRVRRMVLLAGIPSFSSMVYFPLIIFSGRTSAATSFLVGIYLLLLLVVTLVVYSLVRLNHEIKRLKEIGLE